ncbi:hypothetical protein [Chitinophaga sp. ARDCPP14]
MHQPCLYLSPYANHPHYTCYTITWSNFLRPVIEPALDKIKMN